jgi:lipopolysaccharide transport system ATP-binding protein
MIAIRVENLGKRYRIGQRERYYALRDILARPFSGLRSSVLGLGSRLLGLKPSSPHNPIPNTQNPTPNTHIWALKDVSFEVKQGEVVGIIGRNGAGKTTLLKILARITEPTEGYAEVRGRVGSLLEVGTGFHPELTGRENIYLSGAVLGMTKREIDQKFDEIVAFAGVEPFLDTPLKHYSVGMQMRLAFAVAAHLEPEILLVDEVLAVGDLEFQKKCLGKMEEVSRSGRTVLFVSHQMNQIRRLCERVIWLDGGQIVREGPTHEVVSAYEAAMTSGEWLRQERPDAPHVKARFLKWEIVEPRGDQPNVLKGLGPVTVQFTLQVYESISMGHHGIALFNSEGQLMWAWGVNNLQLNPGVYVFVYRFPLLPIRPGFYSWGVSLYDDAGQIDVWHCVPDMLVATEDLQHPSYHWNGILNLPFKFYPQQVK